jgi:hypothetical protein
MKTTLELVFENIENDQNLSPDYPNWEQFKKNMLEKEKEQIQKAFSDGQKTPINHPTLPHYSREEYYNDNYNERRGRIQDISIG